MYSSFFRAGFGAYKRHKVPSLVALFSLLIGVSGAGLLLIFVNFELTYDQFWPNAERIYRLEMTATTPGRVPYERSQVAFPAKDILTAHFPGIEIATHFDATATMYADPPVLIQGDRTFELQEIAADENFFRIFQLPFSAGNAADAFSDPNAVVLTQSTAERLFGSGEALGKILYTSRSPDRPLKVTAVVENIPVNAHLVADYFVRIVPEVWAGPSDSFNILEEWGSYSANTYFLLKEGAGIEALKTRLSPGMKPFMPPDLRETVAYEFDPVALTDIRLYGRHDKSFKPGVDHVTVYGFAVVAVLILVITGFNFMNFTHAVFSFRSQELAIRKIHGATSRQLIGQTLSLISLIVLIPLILSLPLIEMGIPLINAQFLTHLEFTLFQDPILVVITAGLLLATALSGGVFPVNQVIRTRAVTLLGKKRPNPLGGRYKHSIMITVQFAIAIALMAVVFITFAQINYVQKRPLGFETDNRLLLKGVGRSGIQQAIPSMVQRIRALPDVEGVAFSSRVPGEINRGYLGLMRPGYIGGDTGFSISSFFVGFGFFATYGIKPIAGRVFSGDFGQDILYSNDGDGVKLSDNANVVLNMAAVTLLGFTSPEEAIGQPLVLGPASDLPRSVKIIGVVPDLPWQSPKVKPLPLAYAVYDGQNDFLTISFRTGDFAHLIGEIERIWQDTGARHPLKYSLAADNWLRTYEQDLVRGRIVMAFAVLAVILSVSGIYGVTLFDLGQRKREIGIRKTLGATTRRIAGLFLFQYAKPILAANLLAWPVVWYLMNLWLQGYTQRISLGPGYFIAAGLCALLVALATIGFEIMNAARQSPSRVLRYE